jgi:hypothetical protein
MFKKISGLIQVGEHPALFIYNILLSVIAKDRTPTTCAGILGPLSLNLNPQRQ